MQQVPSLDMHSLSTTLTSLVIDLALLGLGLVLLSSAVEVDITLGSRDTVKESWEVGILDLVSEEIVEQLGAGG